jgi:acyl carrier protein
MYTHMSAELREELKQMVIEVLNLDDLKVEDIADDASLFGSDLELDSIDGLELVLQLEKTYGIKIGSSEESRRALQSIRVLADYIEQNRR